LGVPKECVRGCDPSIPQIYIKYMKSNIAFRRGLDFLKYF